MKISHCDEDLLLWKKYLTAMNVAKFSENLLFWLKIPHSDEQCNGRFEGTSCLRWNSWWKDDNWVKFMIIFESFQYDENL